MTITKTLEASLEEIDEIQRQHRHLLADAASNNFLRFGEPPLHGDRGNTLENIARVQALKEQTGIGPRESDIQDTYRILFEFDGSRSLAYRRNKPQEMGRWMAPIERLLKSTGVAPSEGVVQSAYMGLLGFYAFDHFKRLQEFSGIAVDPEHVQQFYLYNLKVVGLLSLINKIEKATGISVSHDTVQEAYGYHIKQRSIYHIKNGEMYHIDWEPAGKEQKAGAPRRIHMSPDVPQEGYVYTESRGGMQDSERNIKWEDLDIFARIRQATGIGVAPEVVQEGFRNYLRDGHLKAAKVLMDTTKIYPSAEVLQEVLGYHIQRGNKTLANLIASVMVLKQ